MRSLQRFATAIDALTEFIGDWAAWLCLGIVGLLFIQVPLREIVHSGHIVANDIGQVVHAAFFMIGIPFAMRHNAHVRVDIFYRRLSERTRAVLDLIGTVLFLLPWVVLLGWYSLPIVLNSVRELEEFPETYTPGYFILKLQLAIFVALVGLQALATIARSALALRATAAADRNA
jgi:TRAP-type mannitol/chloroaromatic compound transport system permease small subunit